MAPKFKKVNPKAFQSSIKWLVENGCGCSHFKIVDTAKNELAIVVGFREIDDEKYEIGAKIAFQSLNNIMQCDFDVDWDMPYNPETGDVFDTYITVCGENGPVPDLDDCAGILDELESELPDAYDWLVELEK